MRYAQIIIRIFYSIQLYMQRSGRIMPSYASMTNDDRE